LQMPLIPLIDNWMKHQYLGFIWMGGGVSLTMGLLQNELGANFERCN
jgi:hypothetical protein